MTIRVVVADDQATVREGLRLVLEVDPGVTVVGEAADGIHAIELVQQQTPDVVLMDIRMPRLDGLEAARQLLTADPHVRIIILTTFDDERYVYEALRIGVSGFLLKVSPPEQLRAAVQLVARGEALIDPAVTRRVIEEFGRGSSAGDPTGRLEILTAREREVLVLLGRGCSNAEIGRALSISEATAKTHVARVLHKLALRDRAQAAVLAYETGLVTPGS